MPLSLVVQIESVESSKIIVINVISARTDTAKAAHLKRADIRVPSLLIVIDYDDCLIRLIRALWFGFGIGFVI